MVALLLLLPWTCLQGYRFIKGVPGAAVDQTLPGRCVERTKSRIGSGTSVHRLVLTEPANQIMSVSSPTSPIQQSDLARTDGKLHATVTEFATDCFMITKTEVNSDTSRDQASPGKKTWTISWKGMNGSWEELSGTTYDTGSV